MTAKKDQIQRLIRDIRQVLSRSHSRLPWGTAAQVAQQRQLLERILQYLQTDLAQENHRAVADSPAANDQAQAVMQSVIQEMAALRSSVLHPLHGEVATLMQQRTALLQEIRQLEAHRQLLQQSTPSVSPQASIETLQGVSDRADEMLTTLDTTLKVVFESLQNDIHTYHDSLSQGIDKLHTLGRQSEAMFSGLVRQLAEQFGRDASTYLQDQAALSVPAQPLADSPTAEPPTLSTDTQPLPTDTRALSDPATVADQLECIDLEPIGVDSEIKMPYAGTEFSSSEQPLTEWLPLDSIHDLGELFTHFISEAESTPVAPPTIVPQNGKTPDTPLSPEIRALREAMLPLFHGTEPGQLSKTTEEVNSADEGSRNSTESSVPSDLQIYEVNPPASEDSSWLLDTESVVPAPPRSNIPPDANVFTLNGVDNVFLDEENPDDRPNSD